MPEIQVKQIYSLLWKAAPEVEQEPVTYMFYYGGTTIYTSYPEDFKDEVVMTPLYTHPQPKREPLNAHEIKQLLNRDDGLNVTDLVRAVEKAHGIGGE
jgi:hypothetical protein